TSPSRMDTCSCQEWKAAGITNSSLCLEENSNQMSAHNFARVSLTVLLLLACCIANVLGQTGRRDLTLEWIFGPEGRTVASVPATAWLDDGSLIILDDRRPANARTFENLNPTTGQRQSLVDSARALWDLRRTVEGINTDVLT